MDDDATRTLAPAKAAARRRRRCPARAPATRDARSRVARAWMQPLAGIRVIDFTQVMMGPVCTQMLADYGADVIKIERPAPATCRAARSRTIPPASTSRSIARLNRNKRSIALDLRRSEDGSE